MILLQMALALSMGESIVCPLNRFLLGIREQPVCALHRRASERQTLNYEYNNELQYLMYLFYI